MADATRREIVALTLAGEYSVSDLARRFPMSFAAVQKHVAVLEQAGLVTKERQGREQRVRGSADSLREAHRLLDQLADVWRGRIDRIGAILADPDPDPDPDPDTHPHPHPVADAGAHLDPRDGKEHCHDRDRRSEES
ncbi:ArsR/SmtB family transcription factor [Streptomyces phaeochromogenes]|uniref:ArsR/SmtB family transcription factor n=1 Tax=Streptomyces phaeochromogenes TaxID=1923 RepID=UPI003F618434